MILKNVLLISSVFIFLFCSCANSDSEISDKSKKSKELLLEAVNSRQYNQIDTIYFKDIMEFEWDSLFIFTPYTPVSEIEKSLGFHWEGAESTSIQSNEGVNLLVFTKEGKIVTHFIYPRNKGDFAYINSEMRYSPESAVFELKEEYNGYQNWLFFYPVVKK